LFIDTARIFVDKPEKALTAIQEQGLQAELREVLSIVLPNRQGALMELSQKFSNAGVNIKYMYGAMEKGQKSGRIILDVDNIYLAMDIFKNHQF